MGTADAIQFDIQGLDTLQKKVQALTKVVGDLRPMWEQFFADFYKEQKKHFQLKGPGQYVDLKPSTKKEKDRRVGFVYPILLRHGDLAASLTYRNSSGAIAFATTDGMELGTRVSYAVFHHSKAPRRKMPRRPLWDESEDSPMVKRWKRLADVYLQKRAQEVLDGKA